MKILQTIKNHPKVASQVYLVLAVAAFCAVGYCEIQNVLVRSIAAALFIAAPITYKIYNRYPNQLGLVASIGLLAHFGVFVLSQNAPNAFNVYAVVVSVVVVMLLGMAIPTSDMHGKVFKIFSVFVAFAASYGGMRWYLIETAPFNSPLEGLAILVILASAALVIPDKSKEKHDCDHHAVK